MGPYNVNGTYFYGAPQGTATNAWQQADMLRKRGIACSVREINSLAELHGIVDSGRRPTLIGIQMSRVPESVRGHSFTGWHAVVVLGRAVVNGQVGFWINDPNFPPGGPSRRFYSDWILQQAWINNSPRYCVVPTYAKVVTAPAPTPTPIPTGVPGMEAWQVALRYRAASGSAVVKAGKPWRTRATVAQTPSGYFKAQTTVRILGYFDATGSYDRWYLVDFQVSATNYRRQQGIITGVDCVSVSMK